MARAIKKESHLMQTVAYCEEAALGFSNYVPCGRPAVYLVGWKGRADKPLPMCEMCSDHNVKNRGGEIIKKLRKSDLKKDQIAMPQHVAPDLTVEQLIVEHTKVDDWIAAETKRFAEFMKPHKERLLQISNQLLALSNTQGWESIRTDSGTAYRSTLLNASVSPDGAKYTNQQGQEVVGREALLDFALDNWETIGNDLLLISAQKDAIKRYMESNNGTPPPGVLVNWFARINIRRS